MTPARFTPEGKTAALNKMNLGSMNSAEGPMRFKGVNGEIGKHVRPSDRANLLSGGLKNRLDPTTMNKAQKQILKSARDAQAKALKLARSSSKLIGGTVGKSILRLLPRVFSMALGPWGIAFGAIAGFIPDVLEMMGVFDGNDKEAEKDRKKTNELLSKPDKREAQLKSIARMLNQSNIYLERQLNKAEEVLEATVDNKIDTEELQMSPIADPFNFRIKNTKVLAEGENV